MPTTAPLVVAPNPNLFTPASRRRKVKLGGDGQMIRSLTIAYFFGVFVVGCTAPPQAIDIIPENIKILLESYELTDQKKEIDTDSIPHFYILGIKKASLKEEEVRISKALGISTTRRKLALLWKFEGGQVWLSYDNNSPRTISETEFTSVPNENVRIFVSFSTRNP